MKFPARLHVLLARDAPIGVVIRRGPAKSVCTVGWNRATDQFTLGQWLRGRIYERRADISPDGRHLIYFAMSAKWKSETKGSWTAISRTPWLHAVTLWGKGDCWQGGGLFLDKKQYWLNGAGCHSLIRDTKEVAQKAGYVPAGGQGGECLGVYFPRLLRDGWVRKEGISRGKWDGSAIFEKDIGKGWILRKYAMADTHHPPGAGCYWDEHELESSERDERIVVPNWEWADVDGKDLVWAEKGCLYRARLHRDGLAEAKMLFDFTPMQFEARPAPY